MVFSLLLYLLLKVTNRKLKQKEHCFLIERQKHFFLKTANKIVTTD